MRAASMPIPPVSCARACSCTLLLLSPSPYLTHWPLFSASTAQARGPLPVSCLHNLVSSAPSAPTRTSLPSHPFALSLPGGKRPPHDASQSMIRRRCTTTSSPGPDPVPRGTTRAPVLLAEIR